jgi:hypothetical protein
MQDKPNFCRLRAAEARAGGGRVTHKARGHGTPRF